MARASDAADLVTYFKQDHRACDALWSDVEAAAESGGDVAGTWKVFSDSLERHLTMEEEGLFPAFEQATGMTGGPTHVMRMEHAQMRGLVAQMSQALADGDADELVDLGDTLLMLIQQHNVKEEGMLYPMAAGHLNRSELAPQLDRF